MGAYLSEPNLEKTSEECKCERFSFGVGSMQGWRLAQEDAHNCIEKLEEKTSLFGVYDGHGGAEVAQYCSQHLPEFIKKNKSFKEGDVEIGLTSSFLEFDKHLTEKSVVTELKKMAGMDEPEEEDDEETDLLNEEANMPIADLLARFGQAPSSIRSIRKKVDRKDLLSPMIRKTQPRFPSNGSTEPDIEEEENEENVEKTVTNGSDDKISTKLELDDSSKENGQVNGEVIENGDIKEKDDGDTQVRNDSEGKEEEECATSTSNSNNIKKKERTIVLEDDDDDDDSEDEEDYDAEEDDGEEEEDEEEVEENADTEDAGDDTEDYGFPGREEPGSDSGCTAVVAILKGQELIVANAGDSRCVLSRGGNALDLSVDHKPEDEEELERIVFAGGKVTEDGRVNGGLNLSRALGDHCYKQNKSLALEKQMISPLPDIRKVTLTPEEDDFFILACDGIWNVLTSQEVVDFVRERLNQDHPEGGTWTLTAIIEELFDACLAPDTSGDGTGCDNMTCIIVQLHQNTVTSAKKKRKVSEGDDSDSKRPCKE
ncbi:protein phosphatase 1G-like [Antedon mediterranea]|uniref:protein phosphatase 1G-like n=1 Tax=Antedon mediterranea TaxID=105859 RepID=UPI003AF70099